jgi:phosphoglycolate phosphatase
MPPLKGLIFDLEGTLLDGAVDLRQAVNLLLARHGRRDLSLDDVKNMARRGSMSLVQQAFEATGGLPSTDVFPYVQQFVGFYRAIKPDSSQIYPHAVATLERYTVAGIKLGLCTNKQEAATYRVLEQLDLAKYFEFVAGGDTFPVHKPNPDHVYGVITALDVPRENCAFVGDGLNDIRAAHGAGIPCVLVTQGDKIDDAQTAGADTIIESLDRLPAALAGLGFTTGITMGTQ